MEILADYLRSELYRIFPIFVFYLVFTGVELDFPAQKDHTYAGRLRNVVFALLYLFFGGLITSGVTALIPWRPRVYEYGGWGQSLAVCFLYLLTADFLFYWYHRAQHKFRWFWTIHELHHSDEELNATTSIRTFWLEMPIQTLIVAYPTFYIVGLDPLGSVIAPVVALGWLVFTHANVRLQLGRLTPVVCGPQLHRLHHSREKRHYDSNFCQIFPIIDVIFGTYVAPERGEFPDTGTPNMPSDVSYSDALGWPFRGWWKGKSED